ncbi:MAG: histidine phosphatase family protein [Alphaproteobacteria bacterium]|nr:histidine phosphatase family protein [Alphaproteobacteria bacterium]
MTAMTTRFWWVRHAPVAWAGVRIYGRTDVDCDVSDGGAFASLAARLPHGAVVVRSHLDRTRRTAQAVAAAGYALPAPVIEADLAEQGFGNWEGDTWDDLFARNDPHLATFWQDPFRVAPPGGESFLDVAARVSTVITRLATDHPGRDIVAFAHAGTIRAALMLALDLTPDKANAIVIDPLSLTRMEITDGMWAVRTVNGL